MPLTWYSPDMWVYKHEVASIWCINNFFITYPITEQLIQFPILLETLTKGNSLAKYHIQID